MNKLKIILLLSTLINVFRDSFAENTTEPCSFADSVDLKGYDKLPNGSYSYEGLIIPPDLWGNFTYTIKDFSERIPAESHVRGCVCMLRPCVKFCCPTTQTMAEFKCVDIEGNSKVSTEMDITTSSGEIIKEDVTKKFSIQYGRPSCQALFKLLPKKYVDDAFTLFENGTLLAKDNDNKIIYMSKDEFCLITTKDDTETYYSLTPNNCTFQTIPSSEDQWNKYTMVFSVPFLILTMIVYMALPELRSLHGKSLCCYLLGLCIGYAILGAINLIPKISDHLCTTLGYIAYFALMAAFLWLSVISYDLFNNIRAPIRGKYNEKKRFLMYSIYGWGLAFIFLCLTIIADKLSFIPTYLKPGIDSEGCWLMVRVGWSAMIYLYGPIIIIIIFNTVMFVLTAHTIHSVQREMSKMLKNNDSQKALRTEKERFGIFLRLFIVMGITWTLEILAYMVGRESEWSILDKLTEVVNGIQGFVIFALFVLKKKLIQLITKRYFSKCSSAPQRPNSDNYYTTTSNIPMLKKGSDKPMVDKF